VIALRAKLVMTPLTGDTAPIRKCSVPDRLAWNAGGQYSEAQLWDDANAIWWETL